MSKRVFVAALSVVLVFVPLAAVQAAQGPVSIARLLERLPDLPASAQEAANWVDKGGDLTHPGMLALRADIKAHQRYIESIQATAATQHREQSAVAVQDLGKGMADAGIDMARMQSDPVYAQQVQDRMRKMSPQELMAMSQKMSRPMNQDARYQNAAQAMVEDSPVVQAAAEAGLAYSNGQPTRLSAQLGLWREADAAVNRVLKTPLVAPMRKPSIEWENIGCDAGCRAQWEAYASAVLPLMVARDTEILRIRRGAVQRQLAAVSAELREADQHLRATQYGTASHSQVNQMRIVGYDGAAIGELAGLMDRMTDAVKSAATTVHCGPQIVLAPHAVCR